MVRKATHTKANRESQSNGSLMCMSVLGLWCRDLEECDLARSVREVTILMHTSPLVIHSNTFYCLMIKYLCAGLNPRDAYEKSKSVYLGSLAISKENLDDFRKWLDELDQGILPKASYNMGFIKIALLHSLHILMQNLDYKSSI